MSEPALPLLPLWAQFVLAVIPAFSATVAAVALILNVRQSRKTNAQARAALVAGCLKGFADDKDIQDAFYAIEYAQFSYSPEFHNSVDERRIDKLLRHFANTALAWQADLLTLRDVVPLRYYIARVTGDAEVQKYLRFIADWSAQVGIGEHPYLVLDRLSKALTAMPNISLPRD